MFLEGQITQEIGYSNENDYPLQCLRSTKEQSRDDLHKVGQFELQGVSICERKLKSPRSVSAIFGEPEMENYYSVAPAAGKFGLGFSIVSPGLVNLICPKFSELGWQVTVEPLSDRKEMAQVKFEPKRASGLRSNASFVDTRTGLIGRCFVFDKAGKLICFTPNLTDNHIKKELNGAPILLLIIDETGQAGLVICSEDELKNKESLALLEKGTKRLTDRLASTVKKSVAETVEVNTPAVLPNSPTVSKRELRRRKRRGQ